MEPLPPKRERLAEFFRRLAAAPTPSSHDEAYRLLCATLDQVEDELTGLPNEPTRWRELNRMFPPQPDRMVRVTGCCVRRYNSRQQVTYIAESGALEIRSLSLRNGLPEIQFFKAGMDGKSICEICPGLSESNL